MTRLDFVLVLALIASCLVLVKSAHDARRAYTALDRARTESTRLEVEHKRLEAERQGAATHLRVEKVAREKLAMRTATPAVTQYVEDPLPAEGQQRTGGAR